MSAKRVIAVVGATGAQGGGLARAILNDPSSAYTVRALVRDPASDKARALTVAGADVVQADIDDPLWLDACLGRRVWRVLRHLYWAHLRRSGRRSRRRLRHRAARATRLEHVIWSTLEDTREFIALDDARTPTLRERYKVPHYDAKGESNRVFAEHGVPTTHLLTSAYWENLIYFGMDRSPPLTDVWRLRFRPAIEKFRGSAPRTSGAAHTASSRRARR